MKNVLYYCWLTLFLLVSTHLLAAVSDNDAKKAARQIEQELAACPARVVVAQFAGKRKHPVWEKESWGPPASIQVDVNRTSSILFPYEIVADFTLLWRYGPESDRKEGAQQSEPDSALSKFRYRNTYVLGDDGLHLKPPGRVTWPDACWDQLHATKRNSQ